MRYLWLVTVLLLGIAACGGPQRLAVEEKEASTEGFRLVEMAGGYIDETALTADAPISHLTPWVELDAKSGMAGNMGFTLQRVINDREAQMQHAVRWMGVNAGDELRITVAGKGVVLRAMAEGKRWHKNHEDSGGYRYTTYFEQVRYEIDAADMALFSRGPITRVMAQGGKGGVVWPRSGKNILPELSTSVATFYREQIAPRL